jgi:3-carboxy-cis,cis-muconate cycloisomerase
VGVVRVARHVTTTPFDHPLLHRLLGDAEISALFSAEADLVQMTLFESALAVAEGAEGVIPAEAAQAIAEKLTTFTPDLEAIATAAAKDGVIAVEFVRQARAHVGEPHGQHLHFGATSQDVVDTSLALRLRSALAILDERLAQLIAKLEHLAARFGNRTVMGRTRMQDALPMTVGARVESWSLPPARHRDRLQELLPRVLVLQLGGPVGTLDRLGEKGRAVAQHLAAALNLELPVRSWHSQRDTLAELAGWLSLVTGSLGKMGADISLMAQSGAGEIEIEGGGGSSAMPHKQNPVRAEVLVALARHNATLVAGMHHALVHEQERSGAAWTLEWLTLPQMAVATGAALRAATELLQSVKSMGAAHG